MKIAKLNIQCQPLVSRKNDNQTLQVFANIKLKSTLTDAAKHLYDQIRFSKEHCLPEERRVVQESIQQNSFMAHPESILVTMMGMWYLFVWD